MPDFLHDCRDFGQLIAVVADQRGIDPVLVEKDYYQGQPPFEDLLRRIHEHILVM